MKLLKQPLLILIAYLVLSGLALTILYVSALAHLNSANSTFAFNQVRLLTNPILSEAEANYPAITNHNAFAALLQPHLEAIDARIEIIDTSGRVLHDSEDSQAPAPERQVDLRSHLHYDADFAAKDTGQVRFAFPLTQEGVQVASAVFYLPQALLEQHNPSQAARELLLPVAAILILILLAQVAYQRRLDRLVSQPLHQLNLAVSEVARGNFDGQINYLEENELGEFCQAFDIMRLELKDALERQSDYDKSRKELITKISHDLKTPISSIKAYTEGLKDGLAKNPAMVDKYLTVIDKKTDSLVTLIDDLLQHSLQELGQMRINKQEYYSKKLLENILEPIIMQFEASPVTFTIQGELPNVLINVDSTRLEQVIVNLVHNAKKYTAHGGSIVFSALNEAEYIRISVKDTGPGVSAEDLPHIFDSYYRSQQFQRDFEGSGLGLAICKYIVQEHGGTIWVDSKPNQGSTFTFTISKV